MLGTIIIVLAILVLVFIVTNDTGGFDKLKELMRKVKSMADKKKAQDEIKTVGSIKIKVLSPVEKEYKMEKSVFTIGRDVSNDIVLDYPDVEKKHAAIYRKTKGDNDVYFEFVNLAKTNRSEIKQSDNKWYFMGYRDSAKIAPISYFYVGESKIEIRIDYTGHRPTGFIDYREQSATKPLNVSRKLSTRDVDRKDDINVRNKSYDPKEIS